MLPAGLLKPGLSSLLLQAVEAIHTKDALPDQVIYTFFVLKAVPEDSGPYECSVTHELSGKVRASSVVLTVFGESECLCSHRPAT